MPTPSRRPTTSTRPTARPCAGRRPAGVEALAYDVAIDLGGISLRRRLPVVLPSRRQPAINPP